MTVPTPEEQAAIDVQEKSLTRQLDWIRNIDTKVQILTGLNILMIGAVAAMTPATFAPAKFAYAVVGALCQLVSVFFCFYATVPQMDGPEQSLIFFGAIARKTKKEPRTKEEFNTLLKDRTAGQYLEDLNEQVFINANIACTKYDYLSTAVKWSIAGFAPWLFAVYMLYR